MTDICRSGYIIATPHCHTCQCRYETAGILSPKPGGAPDIKPGDSLDAQIAHLEALVLSLKIQRNARALASRLPDELLAQSFSHVTAFRGRAPRWVAFSQVCRRWRAVALAHPTLWAELDLTLLGRVDAMLARARTPPLSALFPRGGKSVDTAILTRVWREMARIRSVDVNMIWLCIYDLQTALAGGAPLLERLAVSVGYARTQLSRSDNVTLTFAPRLKALELVGLMAELDAPLFANLEVLTLDSVPQCSTLTSSEFLDLLESLANARRVRLISVLATEADPGSPSVPPDRKLHMSKVQRFEISASTTALAVLSLHLSFPPTTSINMQGKTQDFTSLSHVSEPLSNVIGSYLAPAAGYRVVLEVQASRGTFALFISPLEEAESTGIAGHTHGREGARELSFFGYFPLEAVLAALSPFVRPLSFVRATHLLVNLGQPVDAAAWLELFACMQPVEDLQVTTSETVLEALSTPVADSASPFSSGAASAPLPNLRAVTLRSFDLPFVEILEKALADRLALASACPIEKLVIEGLSVELAPDLVSRLRALVGEVSWK